MFRLYLIPALLAGFGMLSAQPTLELVPLGLNMAAPVDIVSPDDGSSRLFIVEQGGTVRVYNQATQALTPGNFLDLRSGQNLSTGGERGLLGLAFDPDFASNRFFYVNYTRGANSSPVTVISRFTAPVAGGAVDVSTQVEILTINQPFGNHNGGDLAFGPDGYLYIPTGDGGSAGDPLDTGQDPQSLLGKLLRIDVATVTATTGYSIPSDNPFVSDGGVRDEIWAFGLRNPWRISFDRTTGDLYIGDVGQGQREEVNRQPASSTGGENYGWDCREGFREYDAAGGDPGSPSSRCVGGSTYTEPLFDYSHGSNGGRSLTGGFVYRGQNADGLVGYYVCADYVSNRFFLFPPGGTGNGDVIRQLPGGIDDISTFGEDERGNLFVASLGGEIYEVRTALSLPSELVEWTATVRDKQVRLSWSVEAQRDVAYYVVEKAISGNFTELDRISATEDPRADYTAIDASPATGDNLYRLVTVDEDGSTATSTTLSVWFGKSSALRAAPNPATGTVRFSGLALEDGTGVRAILTDAGGQIITERMLVWSNGSVDLDLDRVPAGTYVATLEAGSQRAVTRLIVR